MKTSPALGTEAGSIPAASHRDSQEGQLPRSRSPQIPPKQGHLHGEQHGALYICVSTLSMRLSS